MISSYKNLEDFKRLAGYEIEGKWYPRVTTIVSIKAKPALYRYYSEQGNFAKAQAATNESAREGTLIHETVEAILAGKNPEIPPQIKPALDAFFSLRREFDIFPILIEERIKSDNYWYAGTVDLVANVNGVLSLIDIKTSFAVFRDYNLQTSAYQQALKEMGFPIQKRCILRLDQSRFCLKCGAKLRNKGGNLKIRLGKKDCDHQWSEMLGEAELKELGDFEEDLGAFLACKKVWEWEYRFWLKQINS